MKRKIIQLIYFHISVIAFVLLLVEPAISQQARGPQINAKLQGFVTGSSTPGWLEFREGTTIDAERIFVDLKDAFELRQDDEMKVYKTQKDEIGFTHYRYQQYYKGIKVLYGEYMVHMQKDSFVRSANGNLVIGLNQNNVGAVAENQALQSALSFMNAKKYLWQNPDMESALKRQQKNESATYYPKGELVFAPAVNRGSFKASDYKLAWRFNIYTDDQNVIAKSVYVDAVTGSIIHHRDIAMNCSGGTGTTAFNGSRPINTLLSGSSYRSHNDCQATDIFVYNCGGSGASNTFYTDADNTWTNASASQAQWGAGRVYSYYFGEHSRQSWDGAAGDMIAYNNANAGQNNACWGCTGNSAIFYAGSTSAATDDWNSLDIMGHEFSHGVVQDESGLVYQDESGALNESFADIFGEMVESWSQGTCDYLVGADRGAIRSFSNPNAYGDPDTYLGTNWYTGTGDNGGVHRNSGVQNRWFHLVSEGGSGTTDFGVPYNVTGITRFVARDIAYRSLVFYLGSASTYLDARAGSLRAAFDLFGGCSPEIMAVGNAWRAVGVESQSAQYTNDVCGAVATGDFKQAISLLRGGFGCTNTINTGASVTYYAARDKVILYPGFRAPAGSRFIAYLEPCSVTMYKNSGDNGVTMSDEEKGIFNTSERTISKIPVTEEPLTSGSVSLSPNPFLNSFNVSILAKKDQKAQMIVYNSIGIKVIEKQGLNLSKGLNQIKIEGSNLSKGVYMVEVRSDEIKTVKRVVKM